MADTLEVTEKRMAVSNDHNPYIVKNRCEICNFQGKVDFTNITTDTSCEACGADFTLRALTANIMSMHPTEAPVLLSQLTRYLDKLDPLYVSIGVGLKNLSSIIWSGFMHLDGIQSDLIIDASNKQQLPLNDDVADLIVLESAKFLQLGFEEYRRVLKVGGRLIVLKGMIWPLPPKTTQGQSDRDKDNFILGADIVETAAEHKFQSYMGRPGLGVSVLQRQIIPEFLKIK